MTFNEKVTRVSCIVFQEISLLLQGECIEPFRTDPKQKDAGAALVVIFISFQLYLLKEGFENQPILIYTSRKEAHSFTLHVHGTLH